MTSTKETTLQPGEMLAGKFRVERVVGRGGMGLVIEATNVQLDQKVALKLLTANKDDPAAVERFSREARAAARLKSEHVARVYDVGKDATHGPFIVMEMLEGKTLAEVLQQSGRVAVHRAVEYVIDACEGLAEAHARGIVHQDVKPPNLFLVTAADGKPSIKLLDFGIATIRTKEREADAKSSLPSAGTPAYLAPEQLRGTATIDHRADIWALGCVLYELLVGERAFRAARFTELVTKILETPPHPFPAELDVPSQLVAVVQRCLEKDPAKRFSSTGELALKLLPFARRRAHSAVTRAVAHAKTGGLDPDLEMPSSMPPPPDSSDFPSSTSLRAAKVPSFSSLPASSASRTSTPAVLASAAPAAPRRRAILIVSAMIGLLVAGVIFFVIRRPEPQQAVETETKPAPVAKAAASPPPSASAVPAIVESVANVAPSSAPSTTAAPSASAIASAPPVIPRVPIRTPVRPTASTNPSADTDIRLTR